MLSLLLTVPTRRTRDRGEMMQSTLLPGSNHSTWGAEAEEPGVHGQAGQCRNSRAATAICNIPSGRAGQEGAAATAAADATGIGSSMPLGPEAYG